MKKTLIALMALAGVAAAETLTISNANNTATTTESLFSSLSAEVKITTQKGNPFTSTAYTNSFFSVSTNVGSEGTYTYTLTFSLQQDVVLESLNADVFFYNSSGLAQGKDRTVSYDLSLYEEGAVTSLYSIEGQTAASSQGWTDGNGDTVYSGAAYDTNGVISQVDPINKGPRYAQITEDLATSTITLNAGTKYCIDIDIAKGDTLGGTYVGIGNIAMSGQVIPSPTTPSVPEPATATLSLLALAGLAARRRRK